MARGTIGAWATLAAASGAQTWRCVDPKQVSGKKALRRGGEAKALTAPRTSPRWSFPA